MKKLQSLKINLGFRFYQFKLEGLVYGLALLYSLLIGQLIPAIVLILSFNIIRPSTPITFHFKNVNTCVKVSICMFIVSITHFLVIPQNITLCFGIIIGLIICLALYKIEYALIKDFDIENCTKEELVELCNKLGYNKDKRELSIMFFIDKLSNKQVWEILCNTQRNVEWDTVKKYRYRIKKELIKFMEE